MIDLGIVGVERLTQIQETVLAGAGVELASLMMRGA
jgi:hypothetical protein